MTNKLNDTMNAAQNVMETAKSGAEHAVSNARSALLDGVHAVSGIVGIVRSLQTDDLLAKVGLARRSSPILSFATFGAGLAVGAGIGVLFAPMSGEEMRQMILKQFTGIKQAADKAIDQAETEVKEIGEKGEELAGKAKNAVNKVERKIENKVAQGAETVKEVARNKVEDIFGPQIHSDEPNKFSKGQTASGNGHRQG